MTSPSEPERRDEAAVRPDAERLRKLAALSAAAELLDHISLRVDGDDQADVRNAAAILRAVYAERERAAKGAERTYTPAEMDAAVDVLRPFAKVGAAIRGRTVEITIGVPSDGAGNLDVPLVDDKNFRRAASIVAEFDKSRALSEQQGERT